jgi:hypothetical protein
MSVGQTPESNGPYGRLLGRIPPKLNSRAKVFIARENSVLSIGICA